MNEKEKEKRFGRIRARITLGRQFDVKEHIKFQAHSI